MQELFDTLLPALIGMLGIVVGASVTSWLTNRATIKAKEREIMREISSSSTVCLGRLIKMEIAREEDADDIFKDEMWHLGKDSDRFLNAISKRPKVDEAELALYRRTAELLIGKVKKNEIDQHIDTLITDFRKRVADIG